MVIKGVLSVAQSLYLVCLIFLFFFFLTRALLWQTNCKNLNVLMMSLFPSGIFCRVRHKGFEI